MTAAVAAVAIARKVPEKQLQEFCRRMAKQFGWLFYHTHRAAHSPAGFPDCVFIRDGRLVVAELKRQDEGPTAEQQRWLDAWQRYGEVHVWRPIDMMDGSIARVLSTTNAD